MLGYYLYGTMSVPKQLVIGNLLIMRRNGKLMLQYGSECAYLDLYTPQNLSYQVDYTSIQIATGDGYANIRFYDEYGNEAIYTI